jgi:uncharacterized membrane protein YqhA
VTGEKAASARDSRVKAIARTTASLPLVLRLARATAILPVVLMGIGALIAYALVAVDLFKVAATIVERAPDMRSMVVELVRVVDISLVGMLMTILAFGVYELFISGIDWPFAPALVVRDIGDLERRVAQAVAVILAVTALDVVVEPAPQTSELEVVGAIALAMVAIALFLRLDSGHNRG